MADKQPYGDVAYADPGYQKDGKKRYPIDTEAHAKAAWSYINQSDNAAVYTAEQVDSIKGRIKSALKKFGVQVADAQRSVSPLDVFGGRIITRAYPLENIAVRSGGDGRTVEAYMTPFNSEAEIHDHEGHYLEVNDPGAFDEAIARFDAGKLRVGVFYNHGLTLHGTPSESGSVPLGTPEVIRADRHGVLTVTRYNRTAFSDEILEGIKSGSIGGQSYTGPILSSNPALSRSQRRRGGYQPNADGTLQVVHRTKMGLIEYGPTPIGAYEGASIVGVRSLYMYDEPTSDEDQDIAPDESDPAEQPAQLTSVRHRRYVAALRARGIDREDTQGT